MTNAERKRRERRARIAAMRVANNILRAYQDRLSRDELANLLADAYLLGKKNSK